LLEIDFGDAKNVRGFPLPVARIRKIFSVRPGDFHRKIFGAGEKVVSSLALAAEEVTINLPRTNDVSPH